MEAAEQAQKELARLTKEAEAAKKLCDEQTAQLGAREENLKKELAVSIPSALDVLKQRGFANLVVVCIVTCPEGIAAVEAAHPDVTVYAGCVDQGLNDHKYIVPGLGDAGDRLYGTR